MLRGENVKIGIVTLFDSTNFGNKLQNYALQEILKQYAEDVVTIKNKPFPKNIKEKIFRVSPLAESVFINRIFGKKRKAAILGFANKYIDASSRCYFYDRKCTVKPENCDYYCAGSDQIWNPELGRTGGFNYLDFSPKERNFSFSASFGISSIQNQYKNDVENGLKNIGKISVREETGLKIVNELSGKKDAEVLIDPTLYISEEKWANVAMKPNGFKECKYLLTYFLGGVSKERKKKIETFATQHKMEILDVMNPGSKFYAIGPDEFIYLIKNARFVCTDSFHASAFSFIFNTPLAILMREGTGANMGSRLETLANKFSFKDRLVSDDNLDEHLMNVDYSEGKFILEEERRKVDNFLNDVFTLHK